MNVQAIGVCLYFFPLFFRLRGSGLFGRGLWLRLKHWDLGQQQLVGIGVGAARVCDLGDALDNTLIFQQGDLVAEGGSGLEAAEGFQALVADRGDVVFVAVVGQHDQQEFGQRVVDGLGDAPCLGFHTHDMASMIGR